MAYYFNPKSFGAVFSVPSLVADKYIKLASDTHLRVILYLFRNSVEGIDEKKIAEDLELNEYEVNDALTFWSGCDVLINDKSEKKTVAELSKSATEKSEKPSRTDVARRGLEDKNIAFILREAQVKFGRNLKTNEASILVYIYDDLGLDVSVILFLLQYALSEDRLNINFIQKTAVNWVNQGVETVSDAESILSEQLKFDLAWKRVMKAFGIEKRKPSEKEKNWAMLWFGEWNLKDEILVIAYNVCIDLKSKFSFAYCAKIIENWHKNGFDTPQKVLENIDKSGLPKSGKSSYNYATYDLDLFEKMLDSKDKD